ncbi:RNA-directed DNA polymerase, eukaryota, reverse transcriptase zinc-binding domain protein [Tanacetum coccineum]
MFQVVKKLKSLKKHLNGLNLKNGSLFKRVVDLKEDLKAARANVDTHPHDSQIKMKVVEILKDYQEAVIDEEKLVYQKAKIKWLLRDGDRNSAFFNKVIKSKKHKNRILSILDVSGNEVEGDKIDVEFEVSDKEIKATMFDIDDNRSHDHDGYTSNFIKKAWLVIGTDLQNAKNVTDYRPIACWNVLYKCISKVLTNRIKSGLDTLVSMNQSAFIKERQIQDNIMVAQEVLKGYNRKGVAKRCSLKIDIAKAYDIVNRDYMLVLCYGNVESKNVIKKTLLELIQSSSGLLPNMNKSTIFVENIRRGIS